MDKDKRIIGYIKNGIVIDHIPLGKVWETARLLGINKKREGRVSLGEGFESHKIDKKGVLKIEGIKLSENQLNLIALVAENATVTIIKSGKTKNKINIEIPDTLEGIVYCANPNCISNDPYEKVTPLIDYANNTFSCHYCNKEFGKNDLRFVDY